MILRRFTYLVPLFGLFLIGCPDESAEGDKVPPATDSGMPSDASDVIAGDQGVKPPDIGPDLGMDIEEDAKTWPEVFGNPCSSNGQCLDPKTGEQLFCVQVDDEGNKICTVQCISECPAGYGCVAIQNPGGSDALFVCMPELSTACNECQSDADCIYDGARCIEIGLVDGQPDKRCALSCTGGTCGQSGPGYDCELVDMGGEPGEGATEPEALCIPSTKSCVCFGKDEKGQPIDGSTTECQKSNEIGTCTGFKTCDGENGWTLCDAPEPTEEVCDDKDNDCNGSADDGLETTDCENTNDYGTCKGKQSCNKGEWVCDAAEPAEETCDGKDNNCNDEVDEGLPDNDKDGTCDELDKDDDNDGVEDGKDNCQFTANPDQKDTDKDGVGDACANDWDGDGILNDVDNCPYKPNEDQADLDKDLKGDVCDEDIDGDGSPNELDCKPLNPLVNPGVPEVCDGVDNNCNNSVDEGFPDTDKDNLADCIDDDDDNDGIKDLDPEGKPLDNCPTVANPKQLDNDDDGEGDACDDDDDNDGVEDAKDNCPFVSNPGQVNSDDDPFGDLCDTDDDNDGVLDEVDNCPLVKNVDQSDLDGDKQGDACDADMDGDGSANADDCAPKDPKVAPGKPEVCDGKDNDCNTKIDEGFPDLDKDGLANCVDPDVDGDGDPNETDCSPQDGSIFHGAVEKCDGIDNNCKGGIDEGCPPTSVDVIFTSAVVSGTSGSGADALKVLLSVGLPGVVGHSAPPGGEGFSVDWGFYYTLP